jgi:hypothetical protein
LKYSRPFDTLQCFKQRGCDIGQASEVSFPFSFQFFARLAAVFACYFSEDNQPLERNQSSKRAGHEETGFLLGRKP